MESVRPSTVQGCQYPAHRNSAKDALVHLNLLKQQVETINTPTSVHSPAAAELLAFLGRLDPR